MCGDAEFGEDRFLEKLCAARSAPASTIVEQILASVQQFSGGAQSDDLTLLVLRGVASPS
jgi:serine phosphatase RsbU (regulator of sigma subunit)